MTPQIALLEGEPLYEQMMPIAIAAVAAANAPELDRKLPPHLPSETQVYRPEASTDHLDANGQPCGCTACGGRLRLIGHDVSEQLEYVPSRFKVIRHVRPKLACVACESIFQAPAPSRPIACSVAGPGLQALEGASTLQLYKPKALIEGMLADPRRGIAARANLHIGQPVQFVDFRDAQMRRGKIIAKRDTQATVLGDKYISDALHQLHKLQRKQSLPQWHSRRLETLYPLLGGGRRRRLGQYC